MLTLANLEEQAQEWSLNFKMGIITNGMNTSHRIFGHGIFVFNASELQMQFQELWSQIGEAAHANAKVPKAAGGGSFTSAKVQSLLDLECNCQCL